jgi:hypothetical protein
VFISTHARHLEDDQKTLIGSSSQVELEENASFSLDQRNLIEEPSEPQPNILI